MCILKGIGVGELCVICKGLLETVGSKDVVGSPDDGGGRKKKRVGQGGEGE